EAEEGTGPVRVGGDDRQVLVHDGRGTAAVPGLERPQVGPPDLLAVVVQGHHEVVLWPCPAGVDAALIHGRSGRGEAVVLVLAVALSGKLARPQLFARV